MIQAGSVCVQQPLLRRGKRRDSLAAGRGSPRGPRGPAVAPAAVVAVPGIAQFSGTH